MRKPIPLTLLTLTLSLPAFAVDRHQSFISHDEGGTIVRSGEDGREVEAQRNLPIYPDDEIITARRGRAEVRLSDGNIIGIDRATALRFRAILDSYEGNSEETVAELRYGKVAVYRTDLGQDLVRLDTENASYVAEHEGVYSVETDSNGSDYVKVFEGSVEVRTPTRATRLRAGESANVDDRGVYETVAGQRSVTDEFERWFLNRAERFDRRSSQYVDRRLLYWADDLDDYGTWVNVSGVGHVWRPTVAVGWRPYHRGYWHRSRWGSLVWVSYDPWGWGTYHYGRWSYDPFHGWYWVPGYGYSPAWVYWMYGSGYVGWAPSGWWDCYPRYYDWAYRPYRNHGVTFGFGFYGRVRVHDLDLRPWTFVDSVGLVSRRVDRAALTADAVKQRLGRSNGGFATVSGSPARFTNEDMRDPAEAIRRRAIDTREGRLTGRETGSGAAAGDLTPFFRRDDNVSGAIRDRLVVRGGGSGSSGSTRSGTGSVAPIGTGSVAPIGRGSVAPIGSGSGGSVERRRDGSGSSGRIDRGSSGSGGSGSGGSSGTIRRGSGSSGSGTSGSGSTSGGSRRDGSGSWRGRGGESTSNLDVVGRGTTTREGRDSSPAPVILPDNSGDGNHGSRRDSWRGRGSSGETSSDSSGTTDRGGSDVPRRVIDRIGGARIVPRESTGSGSGGGSSRDSDRSGAYERRRGAGSSGSSGGSSSGSARSGGTSSGSSSGGSGSRSSSGSSGNGGGGSRSSGGRIGRDQ